MPKIEEKKIYISPNIYLYANNKLYYNDNGEDILMLVMPVMLNS